MAYPSSWYKSRRGGAQNDAVEAFANSPKILDAPVVKAALQLDVHFSKFAGLRWSCSRERGDIPE